MKKYLALLRGINVAGQKSIRMEELKKNLSEIGFKNITTYIQSGNIIFEYKLLEPSKIVKLIQQKILEKFNFEVPIILLEEMELNSLIKACPFVKSKESEHVYLTFLSEYPKEENIKKIIDLKFEFEEFIIQGKTIYLYCKKGYGKSKLSNNFFENKLKVQATTRNWNTVLTLQEMLK